MKRLMRRAAAAVLTAVCVMSLSACTAKQATEAAIGGPLIQTEGMPIADGQIDLAKAVINQAYSLLHLSEDQIAVERGRYEAAGYTSIVDIMDVLHEAKVKLGVIKHVDASNAKIVSLPDGTITFSVTVTYGEGDMLYVLNFDPQTKESRIEFVDPPAGDAGQTVDQQMESGGIYAGIGISTVFTVLIFISLLICCFKFIHKWESGKAAGKKEAEALSLAAVQEAPVEAADEDLMDDTELLLLITTAIAAYEGSSADGLKVRRIRRAQGAKWKRP